MIFNKLFRKKSLGQWGEEQAAEIYKSKGFEVLDRNYFNRRGKQVGEIDLVAAKDKLIVFIEVKTRSSDRYGSPADAVNQFKQQKLLKSCKIFIQNHPQYQEYQMRIDVVEIKANLDRSEKSVNIIENAVEDSF